jgi:error-prone DNA polymerase
MRYVELQVTSNFSFLRGASHPEEFIEQAAAYGYTEIAITDRNTFAGIVRAHAAAKKVGIRLIPGCRLDLIDAPSLLAYPINLSGYS